jgi:hypothetical protein
VTAINRMGAAASNNAHGLLRLSALALMALSGLASAQQTVTITAPANNSTSPVSTAINLAASTTNRNAPLKWRTSGRDTTLPRHGHAHALNGGHWLR